MDGGTCVPINFDILYRFYVSTYNKMNTSVTKNSYVNGFPSVANTLRIKF